MAVAVSASDWLLSEHFPNSTLPRCCHVRHHKHRTIPQKPEICKYFYAPEWTRTTTMFTHDKALNLVNGRKIRPPASRSSVLCGIADASDASDEMTWARDGSRIMVSSRPACPIILHPPGGAVRVPDVLPGRSGLLPCRASYELVAVRGGPGLQACYSRRESQAGARAGCGRPRRQQSRGGGRPPRRVARTSLAEVVSVWA
jgi:hypothetical protein